MNMNLASEEKENKEPEVLYENDDVLVISKPPGWIVHEDGYNEGQTVVDWFLVRNPEAKGVGEIGYGNDGQELDRSGVVHRLDVETSGVLILAKNQNAYDHLKKQFQDRLVHKEYRAFVYGRLNDRWGTINRAIGRSAKDARRRSAERGAKGVLRDAVTDFERIGLGEYNDEPFSYVKLMPKTGRTHHLRVHLRAIDRPIVGDKLYAVRNMKESSNLGLDRMALHAYILEITLPSGEEEKFMAPIPQEFEAAAEKIAE